MPNPARNGSVYRRTSKAARQRTDPDGVVRCWLCHEPIDPRLQYPHPMSAAADHEDPIGRGGDVLGPRQPAHKHCNEKRGAGRDVDYDEIPPAGTRKPIHSREW